MDRREYLRLYQQRHTVEHNLAAQNYLENNRSTINTRLRNARQRNIEESRRLNENEYLGESLSDIIPPFSVGTLSNECVNCGALSFPAEHGRTKFNCCHHGKVELANMEYPEVLKDLLLGSHSDAINFKQNVRSYNSAFEMAAFCPSHEISFKGISCLTFKGDVTVTATTSLIPPNNQNHKFAQIYISL
ncbi:uncharacterized protein [Parasteatoda tepidariorum]|uniref:uncharacterized protein n=1 Tax=Parasteatoda tepidariorum TaxID=114398 RepID=UPI0039BD3562